MVCALQVNNLQTDKEKLESYTKKTLHKFQDKYMVAISHCKTQIAEKNEKIDYLEVMSAPGAFFTKYHTYTPSSFFCFPRRSCSFFVAHEHSPFFFTKYL